MNLQEACKKYIENIKIIRQLSIVSADHTLDEKEFYTSMALNFMKIREYAKEMQSILNNVLLPLFHGDRDLTIEEISYLDSFIDELINGYSMQNLDLELVAKCVSKLLSSVLHLNDIDKYIEELDNAITVYYTLMNKTERIYEQANVKKYYRKLGKEIGVIIRSYLDKDKFIKLSNSSKHLVIINSRYSSALHEAVYNNPEDNALEIEELKQDLALAEDEFYVKNIEDFDWDVHKSACYEYAGYMLEKNNAKNLTLEEANWVYENVVKLKEIREQSPITKERVSNQEYNLLYTRSAYFSGHMSFDKYLHSLWSIYKKRKSGYTIASIFTNLLIPTEYLMALKDKKITEDIKSNLDEMYNDLLNYVVGMDNSDSLSYILEYYSLILDNYIECDGLMTFKQFAIRSIASLHLPTFVHSSMVAKISWYIASKYIDFNPKILLELNKNKEEVLDFIYNAGLLHDVGKLPVIDTVFIYERKLFDNEFAILKTHSSLGYQLLSKYDSTKEYAKIAYSHHIWNNKTGGYPMPIELNALEQFATDVIRCADCLDAATDVVGRSYSGGITIGQYFKEYKRDSGSLYAAYLADLYTDEFINEYTDLLNKERKESYYSAFQLLSKS